MCTATPGVVGIVAEAHLYTGGVADRVDSVPVEGVELLNLGRDTAGERTTSGIPCTEHFLVSSLT